MLKDLYSNDEEGALGFAHYYNDTVEPLPDVDDPEDLDECRCGNNPNCPHL